ncbi:MAG: TlpA family protein disulfide reductase [Pseudobdellovibrionaceae bacterium]
MKQHLKAFLVVLFIGCICFFAYKFFITPKFSEGPSKTYASLESMENIGVPNFLVKDIEGVSFELKSSQGKIVVVNFWASWCAPCVEEVPSLIKLVKEFNGSVQLIAVSGDNNLEDIRIFLKSFPELQNKNIKIIWDENRSLMKQFGIARLPESLILDKNQKLSKKLVGSIDWYTKDSIEYIRSLLEK